MSVWTGDWLFDLGLILVFLAAAVAIFRSKAGGIGARAARRRARRAALDERRGLAPPGPEAPDPDAMTDLTPALKDMRRRLVIGGLLFLALLALMLIAWIQGPPIGR